MSSPSQLAAYADLFQRLLDSTLLLDPATRVVLEANLACENVLGIAADKLVGQELELLVEEDCREAFAKALRVAMKRYYLRQFDTRFKHADGRTIHMEVLVCPLELADGNQVLQVIARDISFRREAESKLQALLEELQSANAKLEVLSTHDEMTGLHNFRHFKQELAKEHVRASRFNHPYAIVFCDVDHFKKYNDRNGHPAGDRLLKAFAATLQRTCRNSDLVARYGGEEFAVICPGVDARGAAVLAERLKAAIIGTDFEYGEHQPLGRITISMGVASFPDNGRTAEEVLKAADEAVYVSKEQGRNRVTISETVAGSQKKAS